MAAWLAQLVGLAAVGVVHRVCGVINVRFAGLSGGVFRLPQIFVGRRPVIRGVAETAACGRPMTLLPRTFLTQETQGSANGRPVRFRL
jgi:hypothetical protein